MEVSNFADIEAEFLERVNRVVWCNVATIDGQNRPRSRILHPIWEGTTGWVFTYPTSHKARHLERNPYVSLAYISDVTKPMYAECKAEWVDDLAAKQHVWDLFKNAPAPLGYDPAGIFHTPDHPKAGLLKLTAWRIQLDTPPNEKLIWRQRG